MSDRTFDPARQRDENKRQRLMRVEKRLLEDRDRADAVTDRTKLHQLAVSELLDWLPAAYFKSGDDCLLRFLEAARLPDEIEATS